MVRGTPCKGCGKKKPVVGKSDFSDTDRTVNDEEEAGWKEVELPNDGPRRTFERVYCVTLDRRPDRWRQFVARWPDKLPIPTPLRFAAIDGRKSPPPEWWRMGGGAWGCYRSHLSIIERCLQENVSSVLLLEDDALLCDGFHAKFTQFMDHVPDDWEMLYLGGQHLGAAANPPLRVNEWVYRPFNVNRTHAFALAGNGLRRVYRWLNATTDWAKKHHIDHHLGRLHKRRDMPIYCPKEWLVAQGENRSNIAGKTFPTRFWPSAESLAGSRTQLPDFVAVVGLHRSGSSCIATILRKLGVHMGNKLGGYEKSGGGEAAGLAKICEAAARFPATSIVTPPRVLEAKLQRWIADRRQEAKRKRTIAGGKYPHLCAMLPELTAICGDQLKVIHCDRPITESIESLCRRSREVGSGWLHVPDRKSAAVQKWLATEKAKWLPRVSHLTVSYERLLDRPGDVVDEIIQYLGLKVTKEQRDAACAHVDPQLRHIDCDSRGLVNA